VPIRPLGACACGVAANANKPANTARVPVSLLNLTPTSFAAQRSARDTDRKLIHLSTISSLLA